jgi:Bacteriocin-protection, YdeI or OmpD-Associated/Domain of unknown function (DUF1905)
MMANSVTFQTVVLRTGTNTTGIEVPADVVDALGGGRRAAVVVDLNGHTYRSTLATMGGRLLIPVSAEIRKITGIAGGDEAEVRLALDTEPREIAVPDDLAAALAAEPAARKFFDGLSYSNRKWHVDQVQGAKSVETRLRRIEKSVSMLASGQAR